MPGAQPLVCMKLPDVFRACVVTGNTVLDTTAEQTYGYVYDNVNKAEQRADYSLF